MSSVACDLDLETLQGNSACITAMFSVADCGFEPSPDHVTPHIFS